jgi:hypothetical protein
MFKTFEELFQEELVEARKMSMEELQRLLKNRLAFHTWAVKAWEQVLQEQASEINYAYDRLAK